MSNEADEIPPHSSSSSSMNVPDDIAKLSYKELQALALRYHVPGNIKVSCHVIQINVLRDNFCRTALTINSLNRFSILSPVLFRSSVSFLVGIIIGN